VTTRRLHSRAALLDGPHHSEWHHPLRCREARRWHSTEVADIVIRHAEWLKLIRSKLRQLIAFEVELIIEMIANILKLLKGGFDRHTARCRCSISMRIGGIQVRRSEAAPPQDRELMSFDVDFREVNPLVRVDLIVKAHGRHPDCLDAYLSLLREAMRQARLGGD
jgi:hypothetical protein